MPDTMITDWKPRIGQEVVDILVLPGYFSDSALEHAGRVASDFDGVIIRTLARSGKA